MAKYGSKSHAGRSGKSTEKSPRSVSPFHGRTIVVTGAASGIGRGTAERLYECGATVVALDVVQAHAPRRSSKSEGTWVSSRLDVSDEPAVEQAVSELVQAHGPIGGVVHAAGTMALGDLCDARFDVDACRRAWDVNVRGLLTIVRATIGGMTSLGEGVIVAVASNAGTTPRLGMGAYCVSKAAEIMLARCLGLELAPRGIRCNVVSPGSTDTPMLRQTFSNFDPTKVVNGDVSRHRLGIPLGRIAQVNDVVDVILFLLSPAARHITMQNVVVDGGATF